MNQSRRTSLHGSGPPSLAELPGASVLSFHGSPQHHSSSFFVQPVKVSINNTKELKVAVNITIVIRFNAGAPPSKTKTGLMP